MYLEAHDPKSMHKMQSTVRISFPLSTTCAFDWPHEQKSLFCYMIEYEACNTKKYFATINHLQWNINSKRVTAILVWPEIVKSPTTTENFGDQQQPSTHKKLLHSSLFIRYKFKWSCLFAAEISETLSRYRLTLLLFFRLFRKCLSWRGV